jgi:hypothetical protein
MSIRDGYYQDLWIAFVLRTGLFLSVMAILAMVVSGCSRSGPQDILPSMPAVNPQIAEGGEDSQTRNQIPQRGCDEKSDSSLKKPLL